MSCGGGGNGGGGELSEVEYMCAHKREYDEDDDPFAALGPLPGSELFPMGPAQMPTSAGNEEEYEYA